MLSTQPRQRMAAIAVSGFVSAVFLAGLEVGMPLWLTHELGFTAAQWAQLRSVRMVGVLLGATLLGALSDRFGARLLATVSLVASAGLVLAMVYGPAPAAVWVVMPVFGACVSTVFMNTNSLTQQVSDRRQGLANSVYRGAGAVAGVVAPVLTTFLAGAAGSYRLVFGVGSVLLVLAAAALWFYPDEPAPPLRPWRQGVHELWDGYRRILRQRELMWFLHLSCLWYGLLAGAAAFPAIYFTQNLGRTDQAFGSLAGIASLLGVAAVAGGALILDRCRLPALMGTIGVVTGAGTVLMGAVAVGPVFAAGFLVFGPLLNLSLSPFSMWIGRAAGPGQQTAAFAVSKVLGATYAAACLALLGWLEQLVGIRALMLGTGALALAVGGVFYFLPTPGTSRDDPLPATEDTRRRGVAGDE